MKRLFPHRLSIVLLAAALTLGAPAAGVAAPDPNPTTGTTTWALQPATANEPDGRVSLRHTIEPGASVSDSVVVTNFGETPATFAIYASDGTITADGNFDLIPNEQAATDGGSWITLGGVENSSQREGGGMLIEVPAASAVTIVVEISVPQNATPGDHPAGIVAEFVPDDGSSVQLASRVGVRAHLRVSGDIVPSLVPEAVTASYTPSWNPFAPGVLTVEYSLANDGNIRLGATVDTTLAGPLGIGAASSSAERREILPGSAAPSSATIELWPFLFAWGEITVDPVAVGEDEVDAPLEAAVTSFTAWTIPWSQLILIIIVAGGVYLVFWQRKRSRVQMQARIDEAVAAATGAALEVGETDSSAASPITAPVPSTSVSENGPPTRGG